MCRTVCILTLSFLFSCSSTEDAPSHAFQAYEENGVTIAKTTGGPKYKGEIFRYEKTISLIQDESITESLLYRPGLWYMDEDGYYYIEDSGDGRIAVFDAEGRYHHSIGRKGVGPGEFSFPRILGIYQDTLSVFDVDLQRSYLFKTDGTFLTGFRHEITKPISSLHLDPSGFRVEISLARQNFFQSPEQGEEWNQRTAIITNASGDTIATISTPAILTGYRIGPDGLRIPKYFSGRPQIVYKRGKGILVCGGQDPMLEWYNLEGKLLRRIEIEKRPEPVSQEIHREIIASLRERVRTAQTSRAKDRAQRSLDNVFIPEIKGFSSIVIVDDYGYIWIQRQGYFPSYDSERLPVFHLLSPEGEYLGDTVRPHQFGTISNGYFLATLLEAITMGESSPSSADTFIAYRIIPAVDGLKYP